ncbi:MAG: hypothetical protein H6832_13880 [Planctomycetes bacterium]|nr:hypothetical protein [Planctomycetota bacterium]MCB9891255.1 hypothetical protein [Planctomycetota bacterium]MCB9919486.1 hypothetical protein [Planctomycetota bacterium]
MRTLPITLLALAGTFSVVPSVALPAQSSSDRKSFETRFSKASDVDRLLELALWAEGKNLNDEAKRCYEKVVRIDPDHVAANRALGRVRVGDRWLSKEEAEAAKDQLEAGEEAARKGERKAAEPIVLDLPSEDMDRATITGSLKGNAAAARKIVASWIDVSGGDETAYNASISPHVQVMAQVPQEVVDQLAQIGEYVYRRVNWITWGKTDVNPFPASGQGRFHHYAVAESDYNSLLGDFSVKKLGFSKKAAEDAIKLTKEGSNFTTEVPYPLLMQRTVRNLASGMANTMGAHWVGWNSRAAKAEINIKNGKSQGGARGRGNLLTWLEEGLGIWTSIDAIGSNSTWRFTTQVYSNVGRESKGADADRIAMCYEYATNQLGKNARAKNFYQLTRAGLNEMTDLDLAIAWSIVDYMIRERTHEWRAMFQRLNKTPTFRLIFIEVFGEKAHQETLRKVMKSKDDMGLEELYRNVIGDFEQQWRAWAKARYQAEYEDPGKRPAVTPPFQPIVVGGDDSEDDDDEKDPKKKKKKKVRRR